MYIVYLDNMLLPITPKKIQIGIKNNNKTINLVNEGEVNILKKAGLTGVKFQMRIPHYDIPDALDLREVSYYLNKLESLKVQEKLFQFIVYRQSYHTNLKVSLEDYDIIEDTDNGFFTVVDITLKQQREYGDVKGKLETVEINGQKILTVTLNNTRPHNKTVPVTVRVGEGDTLYKIAKKYLGDGELYSELMKINNISDPNYLKVGEVVRLHV